MNKAVELPSLDEIAILEKKQAEALESLDITTTAAGDSVKCQKCGSSVPIIGQTHEPSADSDRISVLRKRIRTIEETWPHAKDIHAKLNEEVDYLLKQEAKRGRIGKLPLYRSAATGYEWFCSCCFDKAYSAARHKK